MREHLEHSARASSPSEPGPSPPWGHRFPVRPGCGRKPLFLLYRSVLTKLFLGTISVLVNEGAAPGRGRGTRASGEPTAHKTG